MNSVKGKRRSRLQSCKYASAIVARSPVLATDIILSESLKTDKGVCDAALQDSNEQTWTSVQVSTLAMERSTLFVYPFYVVARLASTHVSAPLYDPKGASLTLLSM